MIYSKKTLGSLGISDSMTIIADVKPSLARANSRLFTVVASGGAELLKARQWRNNLVVSLAGPGDTAIVSVYLPDAFSGDTIQRLIFGITSDKIWVSSSNTQKVRSKKLPTLNPGFLEHGTILIGYSASGAYPWQGCLYNLIICRDLPAPDRNTGYLLNDTVYGNIRAGSAAAFLFQEGSGNRIKSSSPVEWDLYAPLFPKMFTYEWPQPLKNSLHPLKNMNRYTLSDPIINFIGFIPFGAVFFLCFLRFRKSAISVIFTILLALLTSTGIEFTQVFIPTRVSQTLDIVLNVSGAGMGAFLIVVLRHIVHRNVQNL
jgi:VanZ family protein